MDDILGNIRGYVKTLNVKGFYYDKIILGKIDNGYKLCHGPDFICYLKGKEKVRDIEKDIKRYVNYLKYKVDTCIVCITNNDDSLIKIILNEFIMVKDKYNVIMVCPDDVYVPLAITNNIQFIKSLDRKYLPMIRTCLLNIKMSMIINDIVFVSNTETIVHHDLIPKLWGLHKKDSQISIPSILKNITFSPLKVQSVIIPSNVFPLNWFIVNKNIPLTLNPKIVKQIPLSGTWCINYNERIYGPLIFTYSPEDLMTLALLQSYSLDAETWITGIVGKAIGISTPEVIEVNNNRSIIPIENSNFKTYVGNYDKIGKLKTITKPAIVDTYVKKTVAQYIKELTRVKFEGYVTPLYPTISIANSSEKALSKVNMIKKPTIIEPIRTYTIIQSMFTGIYLTKDEIMAILSFVTHGHIYHLYTYKPVVNAPIGCIIKGALEIMPYSPSNNFVTLFKYKLLFIKGGFWVNLNTLCTKKLSFDDKPYVFLETDNVIKCPVGSKFAMDCYESTLIRQYSLQGAIRKHNLGKYIVKTIDNNPSFQKIPIAISNGKRKDIIIPDRQFNLENVYGKYNNVGVLIYWMSPNGTFVTEMESILNSNLLTWTKTSGFHINKIHGEGNKDRIKNFIENDIYIYMMNRMIELKLIDNLHIIFGMSETDKYLYNNEPLFVNGNYYKFNDNISLWKIADIKSMLAFSHAKIYNYKGYGRYEHLYSWMTLISPYSIFCRYLATSFPLVPHNNKIIIDDTWINYDYANNKKCKLINKNHNYYGKVYTNYDLLFMDTAEKIEHYKILFPNTKKFIKLRKYSLMTLTNFEKRDYDVMFCASDAHPSKNWDVFNGFLAYCEKTNKKMKVLITTPVVSNKTFEEYNGMKNVKVTVKKNLTYDKMIEAYNNSKCLLITFGRDATPRCMSEGAKCGCFNIALDILSDGLDMINPKIGKVIYIPENQKSYEISYKSIKCRLNPKEYDEIYNLVCATYDHEMIAEEFVKDYDETRVTYEICNTLENIIKNKNPMIVSLATENYANNLNYLLASIRHTNPKMLVMIYCVNWKTPLISQFRNCYPNYYFKPYEIQEPFVKGDIIKLKVKVQMETYRKFTQLFLWIDADSLVLQNLTPLFNLGKEYGLCCYCRPSENYYMRFAVGVIMFGEDMEEFVIDYYKQSLVTLGFHNWFYDQTSLYEVYENYKDKIRFYAYGEHEHSINDTVNTMIYSRRRDNKMKLSEVLKSKGITIPNINFGNVGMVYA